MCFESKNSPRNFRLWKPSQAILQAHCVIDVTLFREVGALANDLPNRIIDIHHRVHGRKLSLHEIAGKRQKDACKSGPQHHSRATFARPMPLAHLMLSTYPNPQHNEKNNHYLPGCFLHCIDRHFLCRPGLQPETHIPRQHANRRRQRRDSSRLGFERRSVEPAPKRNGACHGLVRAWCAASAHASASSGSIAEFG